MVCDDARADYDRKLNYPPDPPCDSPLFPPHLHCRIALLLAFLAGATPLACLGHDVRDFGERVLAIQAVLRGESAPLPGPSSECNESGCMCKGATLCQFVSGEHFAPTLAMIANWPEISFAPLAQRQTQVVFDPARCPTPPSGKMLRALCASWLA